MAKMTKDQMELVTAKLTQCADDLRVLALDAAKIGTEYMTDNPYEPHLGAQCFELAKLAGIVCDKMTDQRTKLSVEAGLGGLTGLLDELFSKKKSKPHEEPKEDCATCPDKERCEATDPTNAANA